MLAHVTRKAPLQTICSKCEILQAQLDAATDSIVEVVHKVFANAEERSQQLRKAEEVRDHVLKNFLKHLKAHSYATAA
jgi:hypothetical protein